MRVNDREHMEPGAREKSFLTSLVTLLLLLEFLPVIPFWGDGPGSARGNLNQELLSVAHSLHRQTWIEPPVRVQDGAGSRDRQVGMPLCAGETEQDESCWEMRWGWDRKR